MSGVVPMLDNVTRARLEEMIAETVPKLEAAEAEHAARKAAVAEAEALAVRVADRTTAQRAAVTRGLDALSRGRWEGEPLASSLAGLLAEDEGPKGPLAKARGAVALAKSHLSTVEYRIADLRQALAQLNAALSPPVEEKPPEAPRVPTQSRDLPAPEGFETIEMPPEASASGG